MRRLFLASNAALLSIFSSDRLLCKVTASFGRVFESTRLHDILTLEGLSTRIRVGPEALFLSGDVDPLFRFLFYGGVMATCQHHAQAT